MSDRKLRRKLGDRWFGGVCGGLGDFFGINASFIRLFFALFALGSAMYPAGMTYILLWIFIPREDKD